MRDHLLRLLVLTLALVVSLAVHGCSGSQPNTNTTPTPTPAASAPPSYEGFLDVVNCDAVIGWGWDTTRPNDPVKVDIYDGPVLLATIPADTFRQDLLNAGKGNGKHYFFWPIPIQLKDGKKHEIVVKFAGTTLELGPPKQITCNFQK